MNKQQLPGKYQVKTSININAPIAVVWELLKDFGNVSDWAPSVSKSYYLNEQRSGVGTGRHCSIDGFGDIQEYVTNWKEGRGFIYSVTPLGPLDASNSRWWLTAVNEKTTTLEVTLSYDVRFGIFGKILHTLVMRSKLEKSLPETLAATKLHVESLEQPAMEPILSIAS